MKKIIVLLVSVFAMNTFNAFATNNETTVATQTDSNFYTCHFSLTHYSGTIINNRGYTTEFFKVQLNCPQKQDVYATVYLYIDGRAIASTLVKISAGMTESRDTLFSTSKEYVGKEYTLRVQ